MSPSAASAATGSSAGPAPKAAADQGGSPDLKVSTSTKPGSRLAMELAVSGARCQAVYDATVEKLARSVRLPGFRKGRVPRPVLLQQLGPLRVRASALEELVDRLFREALQLEEIAALSRPELSEGFDAVLERFQPGEALTFTLELDVEPTPSLKTTRGLTAEAEPVRFDPARVEELLEQSRRQLATLVPVEDRPAAPGDVARVSFSGTYTDSGEAISGGSSDGMEVELEEGRMIPGFVEGIVGMTVGETRTITCTFPDSYPQEEARSREASFEITLQDLKERELPELDDDFARQAGDKETLAELRADLEQRLRDDAERRHSSNRRGALLEALVEQLEVELPETLIQEEVRRLIEQTASQVAEQGMDVKKLFTQDLVRSLMDSSRPEAEQQLRRRLALQALAAAEQIEVAEEAIETRLQEVRRQLRDESAIDPARLRSAVADDLLQDSLFEWLEQNTTLTEKEAAAEAETAEPPAGEPAAKPTGAKRASKEEEPGDTPAAAD